MRSCLSETSLRWLTMHIDSFHTGMFDAFIGVLHKFQNYSDVNFEMNEKLVVFDVRLLP